MNKSAIPNSQNSTPLTQTGSRPTIGFLTSHLKYPNSYTIWQGITDAAREREANVITYLARELDSKRRFDVQANVLYDLVNPDMLDGLVIWATRLTEQAGATRAESVLNRYHSIPIVAVEHGAPKDIPWVDVDNYQAMRKMMLHLVNVHGYRRIAFIRGPDERHAGARVRYQAYQDVLTEVGLPFDPDLVSPPTQRWQKANGSLAIELLLDQRQVSFEAIIGVNDEIASGAVEALQARGIDVPHQVAVLGYDDDVSNYVIPPLTTIPLQGYEMGRRAAEVLLAWLDGNEPPPQIAIPPRLVIRQSCGCASQAMVQATVGQPIASDGFEETLETKRADILSAVQQAAGQSAAGLNPDWAKQLLAAFEGDLAADRSTAFLITLEQILRRVVMMGNPVAAWQDVILVLRRQTLPHLGSTLMQRRAEELWLQAQVAVGEAMQMAQNVQVYLTDQRNDFLEQVRDLFITTFEVEALMDTLAENLPQLGIPGCYLSLYENPQQPADTSRLILAYDEQHGRFELEPDRQVFVSPYLVPEGLLPQDRPYSMVVEPLYFRKEQLGFALFEAGTRDGSIFDALRVEISSALQGALLLRERKRAEAALEKAYAEVEQQVQERTIELQHEITERRRLQHLLQNITDSMPSALVALGPDGQILLWNPAAEELTSQTASQVQGQSLWEVCPELAPYHDLFEQVLRRQQGVHQHRESVATETGTLYHDVDIFPMIANDLEGVVLRLDDVTQRVQLEEMMLQSAKMASVGGLAAGVAHEINNPLGAMIQSAQMLQMVFDTDQQHIRERLEALGVPPDGLADYLQDRGVFEYLAGIRETGGRAAKIVADLLSFSRKSSSDFVPRDLNGLVDQTLELAVADYDLKKKYDFRDIEIVRELSPDLPEVMCDQQQIQQMVLNLVRNAAQAMANKAAGADSAYHPRLVVRSALAADPSKVRLEVADNGPGISEKMRKRLFEPFLTTKDVGEGTGLGLWLCWSIVVERHQGQIWLEPKPEGGSRFVVELPVGVRSKE